MFVEKVKSEGLAHLSYVLGSGGQAAVIDPRRDCEIYVDLAARHGCRITHVFETHRNEDLLSGAAILGEQTGAPVHHGPHPAGPIRYADTVREGDEFELGQIRIRVLETPGHTDDSLSFVLYDGDTSTDDAVGVFTGDALFVGDVGRTDFYPERAREVAGLLFDSLRKLLSVGDQAVVYPAHGAGSVCGSGMAEREITTIGYERRHNPRLAIDDRDEFVEAKLAERHELPPYFEHMESLNLEGAKPMPRFLRPAPLTRDAVKRLCGRAVVIDVRSASAFLGAHLPESIALPVDMIAAFAGWLLAPEDELLLVADDAAQAEEATRRLARIGFDRVRGFLAPSLAAWAAGGEAFGTLPVLDVEAVRDRIDIRRPDWVLLDVRGAAEVEHTHIPGSRHIYLGELQSRVDELDRAYHYTVMCGSGTRATIAASIMLRAGFSDVDLFLGSIGAWRSKGLATTDRA
jgi:hydroxyacylglutathione hydrolase